VDENWNPTGKSNLNLILDTREYEVKLNDGTVLEYSANATAENLFAQVDKEGRWYVLLDAIIDYKKDQLAISRMMNLSR
jgi:hypothetical protein